MSLVEAKETVIPISAKAHFGRSLGLALTAPFFRRRVIDQDNGFDRARELANQGYGTVVLLNHFSKGETTRVIATIAERPIFHDREILVPQAVHHYKNWYRPVGKFMGVTVSPITIEDTVQYVADHPEKTAKYANYLTREGATKLLNSYLNEAVRVLSEGGVVILFPQGGRCPYLEKVTSAVSTLMNRTNRAKVSRFTIMTMGAEIPGLNDYSDESIIGMNLGKMYAFRVGGVFENKDFIEATRVKKLTPDQLALEELKLVVSPNYLPRNTTATS